MICVSQKKASSLKTLKASPLSNRGGAQYPRNARRQRRCTLEGCPSTLFGDPFGVGVTIAIKSAGRADLRLLRGDAFGVNVLHPFIKRERMVAPESFFSLFCVDSHIKDVLLQRKSNNDSNY